MASHDYSEMAGIGLRLSDAFAGLRELHREVGEAGPAAAKTIRAAYMFADADRAQADAAAATVLKCATEVAEALNVIHQALMTINRQALKATDAIDENEARRKTTHARLTR